MENIIINIHNEKLADLNEKFANKNLPFIKCSMEKTEMYHVDEWSKEKTPYTKMWQDRCHPLGWLCELPHYP